MSKLTRREFLEESLLATAVAAALPVLPGEAMGRTVTPSSPNEAIRVGVIGVRGRGRAHIVDFLKSKDSEVVAICDPDEGVTGLARKAAPRAKYYRDIRKMLEDDSIDAVSIATPNHWHSLATIWAVQAGKHVFVEKPISQNVAEGRVVVEASQKHGRLVQHGTQARSHKATMEAMDWLHAGGLGKIHVARGLCYKRRKSIGKVEGAQKPPATLDYDLWTGPAEMQPLMRKNLHYDWHWVWNTGNGDIGNQGVHQMDIARWGLGKMVFPNRVMSCGGRLGYEDDAETPNTHISVFDYGDQKIVFEVRGLKTGPYRTATIGTIFHCEHGYLVSASYSKVLAFDRDGKLMKTFTGGGNHIQNFLDAVKSGKESDLNSGPLEGHLTAALCHLGNIPYRLGQSRKLSATDTPFGETEVANETFRRFRSHLEENGFDASRTDYQAGPILTLDPSTEQFKGAHAAQANSLLTRKNRAPFLVK